MQRACLDTFRNLKLEENACNCFITFTQRLILRQKKNLTFFVCLLGHFSIESCLVVITCFACTVYYSYTPEVKSMKRLHTQPHIHVDLPLNYKLILIFFFFFVLHSETRINFHFQRMTCHNLSNSKVIESEIHLETTKFKWQNTFLLSSTQDRTKQRKYFFLSSSEANKFIIS